MVKFTNSYQFKLLERVWITSSWMWWLTLISLELFDSRPLNLHLLNLVRIVYITFCCSFCVLSYFQVLVEI